MMAGRPGPRHKSKIADEFDALIQASSGGRKDWAGQRRQTMMFLVGAASSIRKATALSRCITHPARAWASRTKTPAPRERLLNAVRGSVHGHGSRVQVAHGLPATSRQRGGTGAGTEEGKPLLECASRIVPSNRYRETKGSRCALVR